MVNKVIIEGYIHDVPKKVVTEAGNVYYTGTMVCYRDTKTRSYDCMSLIFTKQQFDFYKKLVGEGRPRICVVGHIRTFKGANTNIQIEYFALYPFTQILTGGAKEVVEETEENEVASDPDAIDSDLLPF